jgi:ABC-type transport system involved in cytochrome c biogenesis permease subunit
MKRLVHVGGICSLVLLLTLAAQAGEPRWQAETLDLAGKLPVQEGGRIKPLATFAAFKMLKLHGKRRMRVTLDGEQIRLEPVEWLLDCLVRPELAARYPTFGIDNSDIVAAIGVQPHDKRRDRYSYEELEPGVEQLFTLAERHSARPAEHRSANQEMILHLADKVHDYQALTRFLDFARSGQGLLGAHRARALALFPPVDPSEKTWLSPGALANMSFHDKPADSHAQALDGLTKIALATPGSPEMASAMQNLHKTLNDAASSRGEARAPALEASFYKARLFPRSQVCFILSFLLLALSWLAPQSAAGRKLRWSATATTVLAVCLLTAGIIMRCWIRGRPPVTTLYETILFTTAVAVFTALAMERMHRFGVALALAALVGAAGMFLAYRHEVSRGVDTMPSMVAVLDSNFWLATHVTTMAIGYAAGLLGALVAHVYLLGRIARMKLDEERLTALTRMVYGLACFCLVFSFIGTVLGGVWANYSWGRFWGWDPKENGALMICLWYLAMLHARRGGFIGPLGMHITSVMGGMIIAFSWWGVNLLGVGLHSYGFTSGMATGLAVFWSLEVLVILAAILFAPGPPRQLAPELAPEN